MNAAENPSLTELKSRLREISDISSANQVLSWDQNTYMPPEGGSGRGRAMATLARISHEKFIDSEIGKLLDKLAPLQEQLGIDHDDGALIRLTRRNYEKAIKVPASLVAESQAHHAEVFQLWVATRPTGDFSPLVEPLKRTVELSRRFAQCFTPYAHIADPLIDFSDDGMTVAILRPLFADLREFLVPLVEAIAARPRPDDSVLSRSFPEDLQLAFGEQIIRAFGFEFPRGRQDRAPHPFMTKFSSGDVRITTRVRENDFSQALFSTLHECGHALYELGIDRSFEGLPLNSGASAGVHESQSRLWENVVGRSRGFWEHYFPKAQALFPAQFAGVSLDQFYRAINTVERSVIRTDADEVTYNLHVIIRFELELALLEGTLETKDLAETWHERYQAALGMRAPDDKDGVLQDVHWFSSSVGGVFQGYTLGNILSAQIFEAACRSQPGIPNDIRSGEFSRLRGWLTDKLYRHGSKYMTPELIRSATGRELTVEPYKSYLKKKFGELYSLDA